MSRTAHRLFSSPLRFSARVNLNTVARSSRPMLSRRMMSSESHASSAPSDTPWIIGSALVFGPLFLYLVSPSARNGPHGHTGHGHNNHHDKHEDKHVQRVESHREEDATPISDDEGTEISAQEVKESMEKAFEVDSPKDAQEREGAVTEAVTTTVENAPAEAHSQESSADATLAPESLSNAEASHATGDDETQGTTSGGERETEAESKA